MQYRKSIIAVIVSVGALAWMGLDRHAEKNPDKRQSPLGLKLVATYEPLHLFIYADTSSTNKLPDFLVCEGNDDVVHRQNTDSNTIETTYFEKGFNVLLTRRDKNGKILERMESCDDDLGRMKYTYIDKHGDGLWDVFLDHTRHMFYVRSNLCWAARP